jgi:rhodanese-related sulfurtransferase
MAVHCEHVMSLNRDASFDARMRNRAVPPPSERTMKIAMRGGGQRARAVVTTIAAYGTDPGGHDRRRPRGCARGTPAETDTPVDCGAVALVLDVRERKEFEEAHLPAVNVPRGLLKLSADPASPVAHTKLTADRAGRILVCCTKSPSARSLLAAQTLASMGYDGVEVLDGGLVAWEAAGLPVEREASRT